MKCKSSRKNVGQRQVVLIIYLYGWPERRVGGNVPLKQTRLGVIRQGRASLELNSLGIQITACTVGARLPSLPLRRSQPSSLLLAPPLFSFARCFHRRVRRNASQTMRSCGWKRADGTLRTCRWNRLIEGDLGSSRGSFQAYDHLQLKFSFFPQEKSCTIDFLFNRLYFSLEYPGGWNKILESRVNQKEAT